MTMKKMISLALAACMALALAIPAGAVTSSSTQRLDSLEITTRFQGNEVIKTIDRSDCLDVGNVTDKTIDYDSIREELVKVGVSQQTVDDMENWYLLEYANASSVTFSEAYYEVTPDGASTLVSEKDALSEVNKVEAAERNSSDIALQSTNGFNDNDKNNSYMKFEIVVLPISGHQGLFSYRTASTWLLPPPAYRGKDFIGSSSKNSSIVDSTRAGFIKYDKHTYDSAGTEQSVQRDIEVRTSSFRNAEDGTYAGSAGLITLPKDQNYPQGISHIAYKNIRSAYYYQAKVDFYTTTQNIKVFASYLHQVVYIAVTPNLVIDSGSLVRGSIGVSIATGYTRTAQISGNFDYVPG